MAEALTTEVRLLTGDCQEVLATLPESSCQACVTSPPYWGLRDYGVPATIWPRQAISGYCDPPCRREHQWREPEPHPTRGSRGGSGKGSKNARTPQLVETLDGSR